MVFLPVRLMPSLQDGFENLQQCPEMEGRTRLDSQDNAHPHATLKQLFLFPISP